jgi:hypothetical protein
VEEARQTGFFLWFHLEETARHQNGPGTVLRFQPSGDKFHDLASVWFETANGAITAVTLRLARSFIDGPDEAFARDMASAFLRNALPEEDRAQAYDLIEQIANDYRGARPLIVHANAVRGVPQPFTPAYRVFLGETNQCCERLGAAELTLVNAAAGRPHLAIRVCAGSSINKSQ